MPIPARLILGNGDISDRDLSDEYDSLEWAREKLTQEAEPPIMRVILDRDDELSDCCGNGRVIYVERDKAA
jgi:hypothetical protein